MDIKRSQSIYAQGSEFDFLQLLSLVKWLFQIQWMKCRLFPLYASPSLRKSASKLTLEPVDTQLTLPCSLTDCSFDAVDMCNYKSYEQLQDDEDLLLGIFYPIFFQTFLSILLYLIYSVWAENIINGFQWFVFTINSKFCNRFTCQQHSKKVEAFKSSDCQFTHRHNARYHWWCDFLLSLFFLYLQVNVYKFPS